MHLPVERALRRLGENISRARRSRQWTQKDLAARIDASLSTVTRMEAGDSGVAIQHIARVSVLLEHASFFEISALQAKTALKEVASVVRDWHRVARSAELRLPTDAMTWYEPAFEHEQLYTSLRVPG